MSKRAPENTNSPNNDEVVCDVYPNSGSILLKNISGWYMCEDLKLE